MNTEVRHAVRVPKRAVGPGALVVVVDGPSGLVALGVHGDGLHEFVDNRVFLGRGRAVESTGEPIEELGEGVALSDLFVETL